MKNIIFLFLIFSGFVAQAQYGYGNRRNQRQGQYPQSRQAKKPDFKAKKYLGFVTYDIDKAVKKIGIKKSSDEGKKFVSILKDYNKSSKQIERINSFTIKSMKELADNTQEKSMESGDFSTMLEVQKKIQTSFKPIIETLKEENKKLKAALEKLLSKKQYKKWQKFDRKSRN